MLGAICDLIFQHYKSRRIVIVRIFRVDFIIEKRQWDTIPVGICLFPPDTIFDDDLAKEEFAFASAITGKPRS